MPLQRYLLERVNPMETFETSEIAVGRSQHKSMLNGNRGDTDVCHKISLPSALLTSSGSIS